MITSKDLNWLSGLLEGEGCFSILKSKQLEIILQMTDKDVVERAASLLKVNVRGPVQRSPKHRSCWRLSVGGAKAAGWMMILYSLMGARRKAKMKALLAQWKDAERVRSPKGIHQKPQCHPHKLHKGHGWCSSCYMNNVYHYGPFSSGNWPHSLITGSKITDN